jgi:hypothetical protein
LPDLPHRSRHVCQRVEALLEEELHHRIHRPHRRI